MRKPTLACSVCAGPMWEGKGTRSDGTQMCQPCRRVQPKVVRSCLDCGAEYKWTSSARCNACRYTRAKQKARAAGKLCPECDEPATAAGYCNTHYSYKWRAENGHGWSRNGGPGWYLNPAVRLSIYERDEWSCQLCGDPVDRELMGQGTKYAPSLDHIIPQSAQDEPDHSPENLRLAHVGCNARRGNREWVMA